MGIIYNRNAEEKELYSAYGLTVYGKANRYDSEFSPEVEFVYITLRIADEEKTIIDEYMGNNCIFPSVFDRTIDNFLYWIVNDKPDTYGIQNAIRKCLCSSNCLFNSQMENRKRKERDEAVEKARCEEIRVEEQKRIDTVKQYCKAKNLLFKQCWNDVYLIKLHNEKARELIENANNDSFEKLRDFMVEHPDNTDAVIVMDGKLEDIAMQIV